MGQWKSAAVKTIIKPDRARAREYERFFSGMTVLILGIVFLGSAKAYFLAGPYGSHGFAPERRGRSQSR
jgi:hypothetical protein